MKNFILIILIVLACSSCSLIPRITFDNKNTVPQKIEKVKRVIRCKGDIKLDEFGRVITCEEGYYSNENTYNKEERKTTLKEKIINFMSGLIGWSFWIFIGLIIFAPGLLSFIFGRFIEGVFGVSRKALTSTIRAVKTAKNNGGKYLEELKTEHNRDNKVKKLINELRADIDTK